LGLSPGGRLPSKPIEPEAPVSHYTRMAMERRNEAN
jgi:hypothetical protein